MSKNQATGETTANNSQNTEKGKQMTVQRQEKRSNSPLLRNDTSKASNVKSIRQVSPNTEEDKLKEKRNGGKNGKNNPISLKVAKAINPRLIKGYD